MKKLENFIFLFKKIFQLVSLIIKIEIIKRKKRVLSNNKKALVVKCSSPFVFVRYFYIFLKYFSIEGFDIYYPSINYKIIRKSFNLQYFNLIYSEGLISAGKMNREYDVIIELNDENLSPDYFTSFFMTKIEDTYHIPMSMHPLFYHNSYWNQSLNLIKKRKKSIFMAGNFERNAYLKLNDTPFNMESRIEVYDYLSDNKMITQVKSLKDLEMLLESNNDNMCVILDSFRVDMDKLREVISNFSFFLALPGIAMPLSHNLIEALSVGTIPIVHKEYAKIMNPKLEHMKNAIVYSDLADLISIMQFAYNLGEDDLLRIKDNVEKYYKENLTPKSVVDQIVSKKYNLFYLQAEFNSVNILKKNLSKN